MTKKIIRLPLTKEIRHKKEYVNNLHALKEKLIEPRKFWQKNINIKYLIEFTKEYSHARMDLIETIKKDYPEVGEGWTVNDKEIFWEADEETL